MASGAVDPGCHRPCGNSIIRTRVQWGNSERTARHFLKCEMKWFDIFEFAAKARSALQHTFSEFASDRLTRCVLLAFLILKFLTCSNSCASFFAQIPNEFVPRHVAVVMDGNGRWANARGLSRIEGHKAGEASLLDVVAGAIEIGVEYVSAYAFSTENWSRSPEEVRFLMGFNRDVLRRRRDLMSSWGVRVRWAGRRPRFQPAPGR